MPFVRHRENSRVDWGRKVDGDSNPSESAIKLGCLLRIADASEAMAKRHTELIAERYRFERYFRQEQARTRRLEAQLRGTRGALTRAKREADRLGGLLADVNAERGRAAGGES